MSEPKFTKGPWFVRYGRDERLGSNYPYQIVSSVLNQIITSWGAISRRAKEEGQANARLIAASPEMFEALRDIRMNNAGTEERKRGWDNALRILEKLGVE